MYGAVILHCLQCLRWNFSLNLTESELLNNLPRQLPQYLLATPLNCDLIKGTVSYRSKIELWFGSINIRYDVTIVISYFTMLCYLTCKCFCIVYVPCFHLIESEFLDKMKSCLLDRSEKGLTYFGMFVFLIHSTSTVLYLFSWILLHGNVQECCKEIFRNEHYKVGWCGAKFPYRKTDQSWSTCWTG